MTEHETKYKGGVLVPTTEEHINKLFERILTTDLLEAVSVTPSGYDPAGYMNIFLPLGTFFTGVDNEGRVIFVVGITPVNSTHGMFTFLCTSDFKKHSFEFLRHSRQVLKQMMESTGVSIVYNCTLKRNELHKKFIKFMRGHISETPKIHGVLGLEFLDFYIDIKDLK